jgi:putative DNA primase/helicase
MVIDPWLRNGETALIWAGSGVGKTMLTLSLAIAMAAGGRVGEWSCKEPRRVLLIDGEMHIQDLRDRIAMLMETGAVQDLNAKLLDSNLVIIARQDQKPESDFIDITIPADQMEVLRWCQREYFEVVIIDNLTTVADSLEDENEATAFRSVQTFMLRLKQAGLTSILVHHARKDGKELRGSTALATTFEVIIGLKKPVLPPPGKACFNLEFDKFRARGGPSTASRQWTLEPFGWNIEDDADDDLTITLEAINSLKFVSQQEIAAYLGVAPSTISKRIGKLIGQRRLGEGETIEKLAQAKAIREREAQGFDGTEYDPPCDNENVPF